MLLVVEWICAEGKMECCGVMHILCRLFYIELYMLLVHMLLVHYKCNSTHHAPPPPPIPTPIPTHSAGLNSQVFVPALPVNGSNALFSELIIGNEPNFTWYGVMMCFLVCERERLWVGGSACVRERLCGCGW